MNNRNEIAYRLQREGFGEIQVGWERVYDLTPVALKEIVESQSLIYDKPLSISFPEWWKNDKEAFLPSVILNNIFGIVPDYDYKQDLTGIRLVNLATNEVMETFPGDETDAHLLFICKHILTYCKKVLRSWGKEPYREFRYGIEYLRDKWHIQNYPDAFQRPDVRIYDIVWFERLSPKEYFNKAYRSILKRKTETSFNDKPDSVYELIVGKILENLMRHFQDNKPADFDIEEDDLKNWFWFLLDKAPIDFVYKCLLDKTKEDYNLWAYVYVIADAIVSSLSRQHY